MLLSQEMDQAYFTAPEAQSGPSNNISSNYKYE